MTRAVAQLQIASAALFSHPDWPAFVAALQAYADEAKEDCLSSPVDTLPVCQGRAQALRNQLKIISEARQQLQRAAQRASGVS